MIFEALQGLMVVGGNEKESEEEAEKAQDTAAPEHRTTSVSLLKGREEKGAHEGAELPPGRTEAVAGSTNPGGEDLRRDHEGHGTWAHGVKALLHTKDHDLQDQEAVVAPGAERCEGREAYPHTEEAPELKIPAPESARAKREAVPGGAQPDDEKRDPDSTRPASLGPEEGRGVAAKAVANDVVDEPGEKGACQRSP